MLTVTYADKIMKSVSIIILGPLLLVNEQALHLRFQLIIIVIDGVFKNIHR